MKKLLVVLLTFLFLPLALAQERGVSRQEKRVALVIGNSKYQFAPLRNPVNDSRAIASELKKVGFSVTRVENAALRSLDKAVQRFGEHARDSDVALFFYSGHGLQVNGINYLQPIGADIRREHDVQFEAFNTKKVLGELEAGNQRVNITT